MFFTEPQEYYILKEAHAYVSVVLNCSREKYPADSFLTQHQ
jgi:hypothetical protein